MLYDGTDSPTISVAFDTGKQGIFTLGVSSLGGSDVLGSFATTWTTIPATTVRAISIRRGRTREDQAVQSGTMTLTLDNRSGNYDPDNPASPYMWSGYSILTKGLGVQLQATYSGTSYTIFRGYLEQLSADQSLDPVATITFTDALSQLSQQSLTAISAAYSGETTATRVGRILDAIGWPASLRSLTGSRTMQPTTFGDTALTLSEQASTCEFGRLFADRSGSIVLMPYESTFYTQQRLDFSDTRAAGTIEYSGIKTDPGAKYLYNTITLTQTTGSVVTYTNTASVGRYGSYPKAITAPLLNSSDASTLAQIIGDRFALPTTRVEQIEFDAYGIGTEWPDLLQTELGDRATVTRNTVDGRLRKFNALIESINHDLTPNSWHVSMDLSPGIKGSFFILGSSLLGGTDVLFY